jgi:UDP-N-acetylglucosamine:LPS N-acetylglucosamine transferase
VIPGQESDNVEALKRMGVGFVPKSLFELKEIVLMLKNNPAKLEEMKERLEDIKKPLACQEISGVIR